MSSFLIVLFAALAFLSYAVPHVAAAGVVYVNPSTLPVQQTDTNVTFSISFSGMDHFKSFDVYVKVDPNVLLPISIDTSGSFLQTLITPIANCVNGAGIGCTSSDGPGIAHAALVSAWPPPIDSPWAGNLFSVTFKVKSDPGTFIHPFNDTIIDSATSSPVVHTTVPGLYGKPGQFEFSSAPSLTIPLTGTNQSLVTVTSLNGFSGVVNLTATVPSLASYFLNVSVQPAQVRVDPTASATFSLVLFSATSRGAYPGSFTVNIIGTSGPAYNATSIIVVIPEVFLLYKVLYPSQGVQGETVSLQNTFQNAGELPIRIVGVTFASGFGTFTLFSAHTAGPTICGQGYTGTIDVINGQSSRSLSLTIPQTAAPGNYTFTVTVSWQYQQTEVIYNNPVTLWCDTQPLILQRSMIVVENSEPNPAPNPSPNPTPNPLGQIRAGANAISSLMAQVLRNWPIALSAYLGIVVSVVLLIIRKRPPKLCA